MTRHASSIVAGALIVMAGVLPHTLRPAESGASSGPDVITTAPVVVDATGIIRPINKDLLGFHGRYDATTIATSFGAFGPTTQRHVMSAHDFMAYDCTTHTIAPESIDYFSSWIDAVTAQGARPVLSLSYVPPCLARDGQPKGPPDDVAGYRVFLDELFTKLVTDRVAAGNEPLRWLELWNEPDIPIDPGNPEAGHGYVGTLDEFIDLNLPSLVGAILKAEAESGVDLHIGTPAAFAPWSFGSAYGDLAAMLENVNGFDPATAATVATGLAAALGPATVEAVENNGGFTWPRAVTDAAATLGLDLDFVAVHFYPNNPLQGVQFPESDEPVLLQGRNPFASPDEFTELSTRWRAEFPGMELYLSEWALSAGAEDRNGSCEAASFDAAVLSVMQDTTIDRAMFLGRPYGVEDAPFRAWHALPGSQVAVSGLDIPGVWATAATGDGRTTLLLSQWHSKLGDAKDLRVPIQFTGLVDGPYTVTVESIGQDSSPRASEQTLTLTVIDGHLTLPEGVALRGQSLTRVDIRGAGVAPLPPITAADANGTPQRCLPERDDQNPSGPATTLPMPSPTATTPAPQQRARLARSAHPIATTPRYTG